jgi:hypothetical protein
MKFNFKSLHLQDYLFPHKSTPKSGAPGSKSTLRNLMNIGYMSDNKKEAEKLDQAGYRKDDALSDDKDKVYVKNGKAHIVYRGTNPLSLADLGTDAALAFGLEKYTPRFKRAKRLAKKVKEKYGEDNVVAMGHSLGGSLAEASGIKKCVTFNKGVGLGGIGKQIRRGQTDYRTKGDIVSLLSKTQKYGNKKKTSAGTYHEDIASQAVDPLSAHALNTLR